MGPSDFQLSELPMKHLPGKEFATDTDIKQRVTSWQQTPDINLFCAGVKVLVPVSQMLRCHWQLHGGLMCIMCYPLAKCTEVTREYFTSVFVTFHSETGTIVDCRHYVGLPALYLLLTGIVCFFMNDKTDERVQNK
jgi:hypothetical protein